MNDFTEFDAFQLCRDFARAIAVPLNRGVFARDPVLVTQLRKNDYFHLFEFRRRL